MAGPGGLEVGRASVRVVPDVTGFGAELKRELERVERSVKATIPAEVDGSELAQSTREAVAVAERSAGEVDVPVTTKSNRLLSSVMREVEKAQAAAEAEQIELEARMKGGELMADLRRVQAEAQASLGELDVAMDVDASTLSAAARRAVASAQATAGEIDVKVALNKASVAVLAASLAAAGLAARSFGSGMVSATAKTLLFSGAAGAATVAVAGLAAPLAAMASAAVSAVAPMAGLAAAMAVPAIVGAGVAFGALKMSLSGMGDAINAADPEALASALAELPPAAQEGALAIRDLKDSFSEVGDVVQQDFWSAFDNIGDLSSTIEPLKASMSTVASSFGEAASNVVSFVSAGQGLDMFETLTKSGAESMSSLGSAVANLVPGLMAVGTAAAPMLEAMTNGINEAADAWSGRMVAALNDGSLTETFEGAVEKIQGLGDTMSDVGGIISGVWSAMSAGGAPFLGTIGQVTEATNEWVNSFQGQEALTTFFSSMTSAVGAVLPIFGQLAGIIGTTVAPAIAGLIEAIAPAVSMLVDGLGAGLAAIAPAVAPLGAAFGQVLAAIAPILPVVGQLIGSLAGSLTPVIAALAPIVGIFAQAFAALAPVIAVIGEVLGTVLATALQAVAPLFQMLVPVIQMLAPVFMQLAEAVGGMLVQAITMLAPFIPPIAQAFMQILQAILPLVPVIIQLATTIIGALLPVLVSLMPVIVAVIQIFANIVTAVMPVIVVIARVAAMFIQLLATIVGFVASALGMVLSFVAGVIAGFVSMVTSVIAAITGWVSNIIGKIGELVSSFTSKVSSMWSTVVSAFSSGVSRAISFVGQLPGKALSVLGDLGSLLVDSGKALIQGFINGIKSMFGAVKDAASNIVGAVRDFFPFSPAKTGPFSGRGWVLYSGRSIGQAFADGISDTAHLSANAADRMMKNVNGNLHGYEADSLKLKTALGFDGDGGFTAGVDTSINVGTIVAADPNVPLREAAQLQLKAQIKGGVL